MKREPIHLHTPAGLIACNAASHDTGALTLSTDTPVMASCPKCLTADLTHFTPITEDEYEALIRRARGTLARAVEPMDVYLARREAEYREWVLFGDLLRSLRDALPWWALVRRHRAAQCIARHENDYL